MTNLHHGTCGAHRVNSFLRAIIFSYARARNQTLHRMPKSLAIYTNQLLVVKVISYSSIKHNFIDIH